MDAWFISYVALITAASKCLWASNLPNVVIIQRSFRHCIALWEFPMETEYLNVALQSFMWH